MCGGGGGHIKKKFTLTRVIEAVQKIITNSSPQLFTTCTRSWLLLVSFCQPLQRLERVHDTNFQNQRSCQLAVLQLKEPSSKPKRLGADQGIHRSHQL